MKTLELLSLLNEVRLPNKQKYKFDFIFHASFISAKGADYCLELASKCQTIFVIPENISSEINVPEKMLFSSMHLANWVKTVDNRFKNCSVFI